MKQDLLLIAIASGVVRKLGANLTKRCILSAPDTFSVLTDFKVKFTLLKVTCLAEGKVLLKLK